MACFTGQRTGRVDEEEIEQETTVGARVFGCFLLVLMIFLFPIIGVAVAAVSRFGFDQLWGTALVHGFVAYLILQFIGSLGDMGEVIEDSAINRKKRAVRQRWREKFGGRANDGQES